MYMVYIHVYTCIYVYSSIIKKVKALCKQYDYGYMNVHVHVHV